VPAEPPADDLLLVVDHDQPRPVLAHLERCPRFSDGCDEGVGGPREADRPGSVGVDTPPLRRQTRLRQVKVDDIGEDCSGHEGRVGQAPVRPQQRRAAAIQRQDGGVVGGVEKGDETGFLGHQ